MTVLSDKVQSQLKRLLAHPEFARSDRMARFLKFVVEQSAHGNFEALKERQIGIEVFDRPADWDPKLDNIVRSEARRLRLKLAGYAALESPDEEVRITVPKGGYKAEFIETGLERSAPAGDFIPRDALLAAASTPKPQSNRYGWMMWCLLAAAASLGFIAASRWQSRVEAKADRFTIAPFANDLGEQFSPAASPDGRKIAYVWDGNSGNYDIYIKDVANGGMSRFTDNRAAELHPAWSPDGKNIAFLRLAGAGSGNDVVIKALGNGVERAIGRTTDLLGTWASENPLAGCQGLNWSPNNKEIAATDAGPSGWGSGLILLSVSSGARKVVTAPHGEDRDCFPRISPDGRTIAFVRYVSHGVGDIYTVAADGSDLQRLTSAQQDVRGIDWTPDGRSLVFASRSNGSYKLRTMDRHGGYAAPVPAETASVSEPTVARTGGWLAFVDNEENWNIWQANVAGGELKNQRRLISSLGRNHSPSVSPDGQTIAFVSDRAGCPEIWFADREGGNLRQVTHFDGPWLGTIRWRPDGMAIVFDARPNGHSALFTLATADGNARPLVQEDFEARRPNWSRDGKSIYFDSTREGKPQIWKRSIETGQNRLLTQTDTLFASESMDGSALFYQDGQQHLWSSDPNGAHPMKLSLELRPQPDLDWFVTRNQIYFSRTGNSSSAIYSYNISRRTIKKLGETVGPLAIGTPSLIVSPNGQSILYAVKEHTRSEIKLRREVTVGGDR